MTRININETARKQVIPVDELGNVLADLTDLSTILPGIPLTVDDSTPISVVGEFSIAAASIPLDVNVTNTVTLDNTLPFNVTIDASQIPLTVDVPNAIAVDDTTPLDVNVTNSLALAPKKITEKQTVVGFTSGSTLEFLFDTDTFDRIAVYIEATNTGSNFRVRMQQQGDTGEAWCDVTGDFDDIRLQGDGNYTFFSQIPGVSFRLLGTSQTSDLVVNVIATY